MMNEIPLTCKLYKYEFFKTYTQEETETEFVCARNFDESLEKFKGSILGKGQLRIVKITLVIDTVFLRGINDIEF